MKHIVTAVTLSAAIGLSGCSFTPKVAPMEPYDMSLSCQQISQERMATSHVLQKAAKNKGVSGANVAAFLFFWPAIIGNYADANKAESLAMQRQTNLNYLAQRQGCYGGMPLRGYQSMGGYQNASYGHNANSSYTPALQR